MSTLRKFDKYLKIYRRGPLTNASKSIYSFNSDIDVLSEEDAEQEDDQSVSDGAGSLAEVDEFR